MTQINMALYRVLLRQTGTSEAEAEAAATIDISDIATKADVLELLELKAATKADLAELRLATKADLAELKAEVIKWNVGTIIAASGVVAAIVRLL